MESDEAVNVVKRAIWHAYVLTIRAYQCLFLRLHVWGREHIPPGPKIYVTNHITSYDSFWVTPFFTEPVHTVIGPGYQTWMGEKVLDWFEQINAMPAHRHTVVSKALAYLERGEAVYLAPEGDLQELFQLGRFYPGVARIYRLSRVPMIPIALVAPKRAMRELPIPITVEGRVYRTVVVFRGPYCINIGEPFAPDIPEGTEKEQEEHILKLLAARIQSLSEEVRMNKFWL